MTEWKKLSDYKIKEEEYVKKVILANKYVIGNHNFKRTKPLISEKTNFLLGKDEQTKLDQELEDNAGLEDEYASFDSNLRFRSKKHRKEYLGDVVNEKDLNTQITLKKEGGCRRILDTFNNYIDEDIEEIYKYLEDAKEDVSVFGNNSNIFLNLMLEAKPKNYKDFEKIKVAYRDLEFDDDIIFNKN